MNIAFSPDETNPDDFDPRLALAIEEFTESLNRGENPTIDDYCYRYPDISDKLRELLPLVAEIRQTDKELVPADPLIGQRLGDFHIVKEIGRGGMGVVYEARQLSVKNRPVAVKVLPNATAVESRRVRRFITEANAMASLQHDHIVPVIAVGFERNTHYFAMQLINGLSLNKVISELRLKNSRAATEDVPTATLMDPDGPNQGTDPDKPVSSRNRPVIKPGPRRPLIPPSFSPDLDANSASSPVNALTQDSSTKSAQFFENVARIGLEAAKGLEHTHQNIILHRDIKPHNLIVDTQGKLWITDFGLAHIAGDPSLTEAGDLIGTRRYMSPEQAMGNRVPIDCRTDIYSLGATLYELLTLEPVFSGQDPKTLLGQVIFDDPRPPREINRKIPYDLETIVMKSLAKAPAQRYRSAREMAEDLQLFLDDQPIKARREGVVRWLWRKSRQHRTALALGLPLLFSSLLLGVYLFAQSPEQKEERRQQFTRERWQKDLDDNKPITMISAKGPPGNFHWVTDPRAGNISLNEDGVFSVKNWEYGMVELLADPRHDSYRFSAEVSHWRQGSPESLVGIYFTESEKPGDKDTTFFHCNVAFNDISLMEPNDPTKPIKGNYIGLEMHQQYSAGLIKSTLDVANAGDFFMPKRPAGLPGPFRKIAVEVRPESVTVFFEGKCIANTPREILKASAWTLVGRPMDPQAFVPAFSPRGGLGLYVSLGMASFRNVTLEPLDDN